MGNGVISFLLAAGAGTWIFTKFQKYNGGNANTRQSVIAATVSAGLIFFASFVILRLIIK